MKKLTQAQLGKAYRKVFRVPGIARDTADLQFFGIAPTGNVMLKRASDPAHFGAFCVSPDIAAPLLAAIDARYKPSGAIRLI